MAKYQLLLPKMGESVAEATVINWLKQPGDYIEADDAVVEIATDKVDSEVPSPVAGRLVEQLCQKDVVVQVGDVIAIIETDEPESSGLSSLEEPEATEQPDTSTQAAAPQPEAVTTNIPGMEQLSQKMAAPSTQPLNTQVRFYSPLVRNIAQQEGISPAELDTIPGTGAEGRLTKDDLLSYLQNRGSIEISVAQQQSAPSQPQAENRVVHHKVTIQAPPIPEKPVSSSIPEQSAKAASLSAGDEIIEMDRMRRLISEHMTMSVQTSAHVTSFVEADVTNLVLWREKNKKRLEQREGEKITFTPMFVEAVVKAIHDMPMINVSVNGTQIIKKKNVNIGMAAALPNGNLIVPVIRNADQLNIIGLIKSVNDLANRARNNKLQPDETRDGTFTITNIGTFGNIMGTPIINQPQVAILALGAIKKKPAVLETPTGDVIAIRHMMYLSMSYDHRVIDGFLGGSFLKRVADYLETWDINREI
ncbi:2-oxo acid dehydrogenase subunit E2 [Mucilaginibacter robiniae]|uniref:Dihydrolipoamide acetyltransferase component of pyruvate dehydrogenase complex n=1 Tax=Mucilaginibacter robiniae TaxID=2728022 RepID=A0A7L5EBR0_9SPHI|nr:dihydrolipoamide acetyltransferase family protein [Mucilaginibacter robiniae]QJD97846.1 2-oxo acid dehydrogenase subunit E2 [Mucilaginibacter robiniae]